VEASFLGITGLQYSVHLSFVY